MHRQLPTQPSLAATGLKSCALLPPPALRTPRWSLRNVQPSSSCHCRDTAEADSEDGCRYASRHPLTGLFLTTRPLPEPRKMIGGRGMSPPRMVRAGRGYSPTSTRPWASTTPKDGSTAGHALATHEGEGSRQPPFTRSSEVDVFRCIANWVFCGSGLRLGRQSHCMIRYM